MLRVKDFTFTVGDLTQFKFGGYQITYKMTAAQKTAFKEFLGANGKQDLEVHEWLKTNNIAVVNAPTSQAQDLPDGGNYFESVVTGDGQPPIIRAKGLQAAPTVADSRGTPTYSTTTFKVENPNGVQEDDSVALDADSDTTEGV